MKIKDYREKNRRIHIPISEYDVDTFNNLIIKRTDHIDWTFETDDGEPINLRFVRDYEEEEWIKDKKEKTSDVSAESFGG